MISVVCIRDQNNQVSIKEKEVAKATAITKVRKQKFKCRLCKRKQHNIEMILPDGLPKGTSFDNIPCGRL
ncbi:hypothetical protein AGMMS50222_03140 [Endomicrobiia bacterium]|nr:hypothetical protein AGMMS49531_06060 [Endomicrobiia bacterium]GHT64967.1 hypothetical protein AGMMS49556_03970 [Endomicrobiia bacterium]GHT69513.1 hypothetical protein AGMMS49950_02390 [Endomicrobiia bacterium]GHT74256.1 hypothetical protein AGMMS50222_03090 [Endomicrobiia bacterium]GHT74270.1 hypothetical protein AGMMS50222_03140 [Endomicrobiia bacterium]